MPILELGKVFGDRISCGTAELSCFLKKLVQPQAQRDFTKAIGHISRGTLLRYSYTYRSSGKPAWLKSICGLLYSLYCIVLCTIVHLQCCPVQPSPPVTLHLTSKMLVVCDFVIVRFRLQPDRGQYLTSTGQSHPKITRHRLLLQPACSLLVPKSGRGGGGGLHLRREA